MIHHPYHNDLPNHQHFIIINITTTTHHHHHHHWMYCSCSCFPASRCPLPDVYGSCTIDASIVELTFIVWPQRCRDATCEPHKIIPTGYFPLNPGCLIEVLIMVILQFPHNWVVYSPIWPNQPGFFCIAQVCNESQESLLPGHQGWWGTGWDHRCCSIYIYTTNISSSWYKLKYYSYQYVQSDAKCIYILYYLLLVFVFAIYQKFHFGWLQFSSCASLLRLLVQ